MNLLEMLKAIKDPKSFVTGQIGNNIQNPIIKQLVDMANKGDNKGVEKFARNFCKSNNIDFDKEFTSFINNFK